MTSGPSAVAPVERRNNIMHPPEALSQDPIAEVREVPFFKPAIGENEMAAVSSVLQSGWLTTGPNAREFEQSFSRFMGGDVEAIAVSSATAGLHLAAEACGIGPGDEVLVPTLTFTATAAVLRYLGAEVVLVDVDKDTRTINLDHAAQRLTPRCKAIMPVHFGGLACDMDAVTAFADKHGLMVIEDAAHALPASHNNKIIGSWDSQACVFSFYANKPITTGEGGMVVTRDPEIADRVRKMRTHGLNRDAFDRFTKVSASWAYDVVAPGYKYNLTDMAAALGVQQLARAHELQAARQGIAEQFLAGLADLPLELPVPGSNGDLHSWHLFPVCLAETARVTRDELIEKLSERKIGTSVHYRPLHQMTYWKERYPSQTGEFGVADRYFAGAVSLPLFPGMSQAQVDYVLTVLHETLG